ncbi:accessory factor UbiK family protein [Cobetia sp. 4B]|jgi:BMFP domain-containing protein YqiC|uniref:accessory factor UbiK family protein n=1 Tax=Cobetia sp. 4B TaxID=2758724 RepID=UPI001C04B05E|nr:accessory factor UbiK family protein [Cobetia sp. 4B]MBR9755032.1 accessory factor UbiK family protein [Gammaproteobacteria bacterium]MBR9799149.1 accessory factor UbiK family protein [Gammaproteobacteria bacterium]QWN37048.1 accessory factor UbiK family protein [Cobetia sp. 4B]
MFKNDVIGRMAQQIGERLQDASHGPEELQKSVQGVMRGAFDRMELVSREDFDIMMDVLTRTRSRVESLEKQVIALEALLEKQGLVAGNAPAAEPVTPVDDEGEAAVAKREAASHAAEIERQRDA